MSSIVGVTFKENSKIYFFENVDIELKEGDYVIVDTDKGKQIGKIAVEKVDSLNIKEDLKKVLRKASKSDLKKDEKNQIDAKEALKKAISISKKLNLNMKFTEASYNFDRSQLLLYFVSDTRIDFRDLAKELASLYKTRIELRQIGVRDKAKETSGLGQCGRELCCSCFLNDLDSVSISMAKNQNLALNPSKINGQCGRLLCCLKYEDEQYQESKKGLPSVGKKVQTENGEGKVLSVDILNRSYVVDLEKGNKLKVTLPEIENGSEETDE